MDYVFTVRSIRKGAFADEPGATHFLEIPETDRVPSPEHKQSKTQWVNNVIDLSKHGPQDDGPCGDIVMYVHGFNTMPEDMLLRQRKLRDGLRAQGFQGVVIGFDWPSAGKSLNYLEDRKDAKFTAIRLVDEGIASFAALQRPDCYINLHLLAHSMGCYVVREAFDDADDRPAVANRSWSVSQIMMLSGDVSAGSMRDGASKSSSLYRHCVRLTNYFNPYDDVLSLSNVKRIGVSPRVGRVGIPDDIPAQAINVNTGDHYDAHKGDFDDIGFPAHGWYFEDPTLMRDLHFTIQGDIDREEIPTRLKIDRGNMVLKK
jgi:esterase/lipase superfamily enzyme